MTIELNRRGFLVGLFGTAVVAAAGPLPEMINTVDLSAWAKAVSEVYGKYISELLIYGTAAIRTTDVFPYIRNIHPSEMTLDELKQVPVNTFSGLFDDHSPARKAVSDAIGAKVTERLIAEDKARKHTLGEL